MAYLGIWKKNVVALLRWQIGTGPVTMVQERWGDVYIYTQTLFVYALPLSFHLCRRRRH